MKIVPVTDERTLRLFFLSEINTKEFIEFLNSFKEKIIEENIGLQFLVSKEKIIFAFDKPLQKDDILLDSAEEVFYYFCCYHDASFTENFSGMKAKIEFQAGTIFFVFGDSENKKQFLIEDVKKIENFIRVSQSLQAA